MSQRKPDNVRFWIVLAAVWFAVGVILAGLARQALRGLLGSLGLSRGA